MKKYIILLLLLPTFASAKIAEDKALLEITKTKSIEKLYAKNTDYNSSLEFPPAINVAAWATAYYSGSIKVGDLLIDIREDETSYRIEAHLLTSGLIRRLTKFSSKSVVTGVKKNGRYIPKTFNSTRMLKGKKKTSVIEYDDTGKVIKSVVNPPDKTWKRPVVGQNLRDYTVDPLTMILVARQHAYNAHNSAEKTPFDLPIYDARRRSNFLFLLNDMQEIKYKRKDIQTRHLSYEREIISGFTDRELKRIEDQEPVVDFYVSEKYKFLPVKAHGAAPLGAADAKVRKFCATLDECFKKYKD